MARSQRQVGLQEQNKTSPIQEVLPGRVRQAVCRDQRYLGQEQDREIRAEIPAVRPEFAAGKNRQLPRDSPEVQEYHRELGMSKSDRHTELQNMVVRWITNRSFKICGLPEANVVGYVADFVAIAGMYSEEHTKYTHHSGLKKKYMTGFDRYTRRVFGDIDRWYVCVFEVKVSRNDFLNTFSCGRNSPHAKARREPVGTAHWVVAEKGICKPDELPDFWGLLTPYGTGLTEQKKPKLHILPDSKLHAIAFDMLWLQMNYRRSYFEQLVNMAKAVENVHQAILAKKPTSELLRRSNQAIKACRGFAIS